MQAGHLERQHNTIKRFVQVYDRIYSKVLGQLAVSEQVIEQILRSGQDGTITMAVLREQIRQRQPSTLEWFESAKQVVEYANHSGVFDELARYLEQHPVGKKRRMGFF
ncbi:hypothetical protein VCSRO128_3443 [Vibrio cholerae]|nr:hypothetical protein VCSRO128_3443 [Vibrio cholerae]